MNRNLNRILILIDFLILAGIGSAVFYSAKFLYVGLGFMLIRFLVSYLAIKLTVATVKNNAILNEDEQQKIFNGSLLDPLQDIKYDEIEFLETPLSFQQEQMYTALSSGEQFSRAELYVLKLNFLHSRVKTPNIYFRNLPGYLIDNFIEKAYLSASHTQKDTKLEFENIDNIFDDENSK